MSGSDVEDIPSDFFDDFSKDDFIEGLNVIDSWDDNDNPKSRKTRINMEKLDSVRDLRDLIRRETLDINSKIRKLEQKKKLHDEEKKAASDRVNIKPGSRRDLNKTNEAIKKDKERKVKELLAKKLDSSDDLRPPGTELDEVFDPPTKKDENIEENYIPPPFLEERNFSRRRKSHDSVKRRESPVYRKSSKHRESPRRRESPRHRSKRLRYSPRQLSPRRKYGESSRSHRQELPMRDKYSPKKRWVSPSKFYSPVHKPRRSSRPSSPLPRRHRSRSRSPRRHIRHTRSRSPSIPPLKPHRDDFLYPKDISFNRNETEPYSMPMNIVPPVETPNSFMYPQAPVTYPNYNSSYQFPIQSGLPVEQPVPLPQPMMSLAIPSQPLPVPAPVMTPTLPISNPPSIVPPPHLMSPAVSSAPLPNFLKPNLEPDALQKLVADGVLSHADYLKLAPNKGVNQKMDTNKRVAVLNRCNSALAKLGNLMPPNKLIINNDLIGINQEPKQILGKFCSPLKREAAVEFHFTKYSPSSVELQNKQIVLALLSSLNLNSIVKSSIEKGQKDMKNIAVQTDKPFCDLCDIRASIKFGDAGTSVEPEYISASVHTQVVEQDLMSSKSMFNPTGSVADGAPISIAHMTPAQLVSQLAARAKTLKQSETPPENSFGSGRNQYDYEERRDHGYHNYNYRY